jgi:serine/threonine-protein kinase RsbW
MDEINLKLPAKPEYVSVARLTTAAIANRLGFSIDEIEDLKVAVSEASIYLINQFSEISSLAVDYRIHDNRSVTASVKALDASGIRDGGEKENELSLFIIESVADEIIKYTDQGIIKGFSIYKTGGGCLE